MLELSAYNRAVIARGSKSFSLASKFFDKSTRAAAVALYSWCRYCDDMIDQAQGTTEARRRLDDLRFRTILAYATRPKADPPFQSFHDVVMACQIPIKYPLDLLRGFEMDVEGRRYESLEELLDYCYCVAGVVGLMMCCIMGTTQTQALQRAIDLGNAMQLTNIARDVIDDFQIRRVYLPKDILAGFDLELEDLSRPECRQRLAQAVDVLLCRADVLYASGLSGLVFLPRRASYAVAAAAAVYAEIGKVVRRMGRRAWERRAQVPMWRKVLLSIKAVIRVRYGFSH